MLRFMQMRMLVRRHSKPPASGSSTCLRNAQSQKICSQRHGFSETWSRFWECRGANGTRAFVRSLWPALESCIRQRKQSPDHEEAWLILAGFLLRPGFGAIADNLRIDSLWRLRDNGLYFPGKRNKCQEYILWRRVAGGLTQERQEQILVPELDKIRLPAISRQ